MNWPKLIYFAVLAIALIGSFTTYKDRRYILFIPLIAFSLGIEIVRALIEKESKLHNPILLTIVIVEYLLLSLIITNFLKSSLKRNVILSSIIILIPVFVIVHLTLIDKGGAYKYFNNMIVGVFICIWTILYLFESAKLNDEFEITKNPMFWISLGNLLFYSGSFFSYGFGSYMVSNGNSELGDTIFWIARILNILLYILYFIGFLCLRTHKSYSSQS